MSIRTNLCSSLYRVGIYESHNIDNECSKTIVAVNAVSLPHNITYLTTFLNSFALSNDTILPFDCSTSISLISHCIEA